MRCRDLIVPISPATDRVHSCDDLQQLEKSTSDSGYFTNFSTGGESAYVQREYILSRNSTTNRTGLTGSKEKGCKLHTEEGASRKITAHEQLLLGDVDDPAYVPPISPTTFGHFSGQPSHPTQPGPPASTSSSLSLSSSSSSSSESHSSP